MEPDWIPSLQCIAESPHAPRWNTLCGDRLEKDDLPFIDGFARRLALRNPPGDMQHILSWIESKRGESWWFRDKLKNWDPETGLTDIPRMSRSDLQFHIEHIVPHDLDLERLIVNPTSGTTGQPISCPNHPASIGCYDAMGQFMLHAHGIREAMNHRVMAAIQLCAQQHTITYCALHSWLKGAGFAKINILSETQWPSPESIRAFIHEMKPVFLSGDPIAFHQAMKMKLDYQPRALICTAITMPSRLRIELEEFFRCPVIDFYSLNETGPIAYSCPHHPEWMHVLPHDIHIETLDEQGKPVDAGQPGEITVTGGRNPYLPLLRYRTGDFGILNNETCPCGDPHPRLKLVEARQPVLFRDTEGRMVNPIDINRILRQFPVRTHQMKQKENLSCVLLLKFASPQPAHIVETIHREISTLFRHKVELIIHTDRDFSPSGSPFICEKNPLNESFQ